MNHESAVEVDCNRGFLTLVKNRRWKTSGTALVVLVSILAMSACGGFRTAPENPFDALRAAIDKGVPDKERAESMRASTGEMESAMNELLENIVAQRQDMEALINDYSSSENDFNLLFVDSLEKRESLSEKYLVLRLELKDAATAEEWKGIVKAEYKVVAQAAQLTIYPSSGK